MKELHSRINRITYYISIITIIILMVAGLILSTIELNGITAGYVIHCVCVAVLAVCLLTYPMVETFAFRLSIILTGFTYFYTLAFMYPQSWTTYILICLLPALGILFYDLKLFYSSLILNTVLILISFAYPLLNHQGNAFVYLHTDTVGNFINIMGSQVILFLIFSLTFSRIRKQQLYLEQLQQSERLKMIAQLTAAVAHEIRNPVTVVRGFLQLYQKDDSVDEKMRNKFTLMMDELNTVEQVTSQFLNLAKPNRELRVENVDVKEVLEGVAGVLSSYAMLSDKHIDVHVEEGSIILMNTIEFKQLLINLIKNALEASPTGTTVKVTAKRIKQWMELKISDQGSGMTEEEVKALGTPFYSLKTNGTGLGLMICFNIVEKYEGTIDYESAKDQGTTVTIRFLTADSE